MRLALLLSMAVLLGACDSRTSQAAPPLARARPSASAIPSAPPPVEGTLAEEPEPPRDAYTPPPARIVPTPPTTIVALESPSPQRSGHFGSKVAIDGDWAAVSATVERVRSQAAGAVHLFHRTDEGWAHAQTLTAPRPRAETYFGSALALRGDVLVVRDGARVGTYDQGTVYVYERRGSRWAFVEKLEPDLSGPEDRFGTSLAFDGRTLVVGATSDDDGDGRGGAVHVFDRGEDGRFVFVQRLSMLEASFGNAVALAGDRLAVGAPRHAYRPPEGGIWSTGVVYLYARADGRFRERATLLPPDPLQADSFGTDIVIDGDHLLISDDMDGGRDVEPSEPMGAGVVHLFAWEGARPTHVARVTPTPRAHCTTFGRQIAMVRGLLAVSAPMLLWAPECRPGRREPARIHFVDVVGTEGASVVAGVERPRPDVTDFGGALASDGVRLIAGATWATSSRGHESAGAAFIFE